MNSLLTIIMAHFLGDYFLQTDYLAKNKGNDIYVLIVHSFLYTLGVYVVFMLFGYTLSTADVFLIACLHIPVDFIKASGITPNIMGDKQSLLLDQFIHLIVLLIFAF